MNRATIVGNLTKEPDFRQTGSNTPVCTFTVAVRRKFTNAEGERQADFIPVVCWRMLAESCNRFLHKGSKVAVAGTIQTRTYDAKDGTKRYVTELLADEVEFLDGRIPTEQRPAFSQSDVGEPVADEDLPF